MKMGRVTIENAGKFIFFLATIFLALNFLFSFLPVDGLQYFYGAGTLAILSLFGFSGYVTAGSPVLVDLNVFSVPLGFGYLCTGLLELSFLISCIAATPGQDARKKALGIIAGTVVLVVFNFVRIVASVLAIYYFGLGAGVFSHDVLFKVALFAVIIGYYYLWLVRKDAKTKD